jgi:hypothetical protein
MTTKRTLTPAGWSRLSGAYSPSFAKVVGGIHWRLTTLSRGFSLARYIESERYWQLAGEFHSADAASAHVDAVMMAERAQEA